MVTTVAGIDVHKKMVMVVVVQPDDSETGWERGRFGTTTQELSRLVLWLQERNVEQAVMESTAQYWKPVWYELEPYIRLHLAQARSNKAAHGRKHDFGDARRLVRRFLAGELILSLVPGPEQRGWRALTRMKVQLTEDRTRLHNQVECLLEEMRIKLSSVVSDLLGLSGYRILRALADGETDPNRLAVLAHRRLQCSRPRLAEALNGAPQPIHLKILGMLLDRFRLLSDQIEGLSQMTADALREHQDAVVRLAEVPGLGVDSAQQIIAEVGPGADTFPSASQLSSWVGTCPGQNESAEKNHSSHSAKGNRFLRRVLNQAAQAAVRKRGSHFERVFQRLLPRLSYKGAIWAIAHKLCRLVWKVLHDGIHYLEQGHVLNPIAQRKRALRLVQNLRRLGYEVTITPPCLPPRVSSC